MPARRAAAIARSGAFSGTIRPTHTAPVTAGPRPPAVEVDAVGQHRVDGDVAAPGPGVGVRDGGQGHGSLIAQHRGQPGVRRAVQGAGDRHVECGRAGERHEVGGVQVHEVVAAGGEGGDRVDVGQHLGVRRDRRLAHVGAGCGSVDPHRPHRVDAERMGAGRRRGVHGDVVAALDEPGGRARGCGPPTRRRRVRRCGCAPGRRWRSAGCSRPGHPQPGRQVALAPRRVRA